MPKSHLHNSHASQLSQNGTAAQTSPPEPSDDAGTLIFISLYTPFYYAHSNKLPKGENSPGPNLPSGTEQFMAPVRYLTVGQHCSHTPLVRGTQWELNLHKARGTWPVLLEGGEEAIFIALA